MSKQLTDGFGRAVRPDGMAVGTCLSCKVNQYMGIGKSMYGKPKTSGWEHDDAVLQTIRIATDPHQNTLQRSTVRVMTNGSLSC